MSLKRYIALVACLLASFAVLAQGQEKQSLSLEREGDNAVRLRFEGDKGHLSVDSTSVEGFSLLRCEGMSFGTGRVGCPDLPTLSTLVRLPKGSSLTVREFATGLTTVWHHGKPVAPVREGWFKDQPEPPYRPDEKVYASPEPHRGGEPVEVENLGTMGTEQLFRVTVRPVFYQPASLELGFDGQIEAELEVIESEREEGDGGRQERLLIVSRPKFRQGLQPFVQWKRMEGYEVEELYAATHKRDSVKELIQSAERPDYILLVGDAGELQSFIGDVYISDLGTHITDLPYAEFTGDQLPDALLGRWPVNDTAELRTVVEKTLRYEQFRDIDTNQLKRALLVAGKEGAEMAPTTTNGQVNYLKEELKYAHPEMDTVCYYNPASYEQRPEIINNINLGASLLNYTAHCTAGGWSHPEVGIGAIDTLDNMQPMLYVNNCCKSNDFGGTCFGEQLLRLPQGGAIGVVGATNSTLWNEDYWWAVGPKSPIALTANYDAARRGAFDCLAGRTPSISTCGELLRAGNLAVTAFGSIYTNLYWEIYCLFGDPTLRPYICVPPAIGMEITGMTNGATVLEVNGTPGTMVTVLQDGQLLGWARTDDAGNATLTLRQSLDTLPLIITSTAAGHRPRIDTLTVGPAACQLAIRNVATTDNTLAFRVDNIGDSPISNLTISLLQNHNDSLAGALLAPHQTTVESLDAGEHMDISWSLSINTIGQQAQWQAQLSADNGSTLTTLAVAHRLCVDYPTLTLRVRQDDGSTPHQIRHNRSYLLQGETTGDYDSLRLSVTLMPQGVTISNTGNTLEFSTPDTVCQLLVSGTLHKGNWSHSEDFYLTAGSRTDGFEEGTSSFPWGSTTLATWTLDSTVSHSGRFSMRSGAIDHNQSATLVLEVELDEPDTVSYWVKISSADGDKITFFIDGNYRVPELWGNFNWRRYSYPVNAGKHKLIWRYNKNSSGVGGDDCVWIDDVRIPNARWHNAYGTECSAAGLGIREHELPPMVLTLYPNPVKGMVRMRSNTPVAVHVQDIVGRHVAAFNLNEEQTLDVSNWATGIYMVTASTGTHSLTQKLIISNK